MAPAPKRFGSLTPFAEPQFSRGVPSPYYKESHFRVRAAIREWVEEHLMDVPYAWDEKGSIDPATYQEMAKAGLLVPLAFGAKVPAKWAKKDGTVFAGVKAEEWDGFHDYILIDEINRCGSLGVTQGLCAGLQIGTPPIFHFGSEELQQRVLPDILSGKTRTCLAITEPEAGSDVKNLSCEAKLSPDGKHYIVNGTKKWITNGIYCDWFTTAVRTSGKAGDMAGISLLLIPRTEGVKTKRMLMSGQWCAGTTYVTFEDVLVPVANLIGEQDKGFMYLMTNFNHERLMIVYVAQRMARVCIEDATNYANKRRVFGKKLVESEVIRAKLGNMARMVESQQTWIESVIYAVDNLSHEEGNKRLGGTTALLKSHCSRVLELVARESVQILGGIGHTRGGQGERIERIKREVPGSAVPGGSEEVLLDFGIRSELKLAAGLGAKM